MGFDQYHEPPEELPKEVRTFARMVLSLIEEAQAIDWYEQRMAVEKDKVARKIMANAQQEEFKHFSMDLEFLFPAKPKWRAIAGASTAWSKWVWPTRTPTTSPEAVAKRASAAGSGTACRLSARSRKGTREK